MSYTEEDLKIYREVMWNLCTGIKPALLRVPPRMLSDEEYLELQDMCANHAKNDLFTGQGIIDTAWYAVEAMRL
jgi:hypothetical protein